MRWPFSVATIGESGNGVNILTDKSARKKPIGRPRHRWEQKIKFHLKEIVSIKRIGLNQVNAIVIKIPCEWGTEKILATGTIEFVLNTKSSWMYESTSIAFVYISNIVLYAVVYILRQICISWNDTFKLVSLENTKKKQTS